MRRKIEYVPLAREVNTYGGRDVHAIDAEWTNQMSRRLVRDIHEWGVVDTEHLSMSLRSRLSIELSYALTTFTVLSTMRAQAPGSGFPIVNCPELLDDALDLMEDIAFGGPEMNPDSLVMTSERIYTNRELVALVQESEGRPFASLKSHQGSKDPSLGPMQRPGNIIISVVAIVRNLSVINDNTEFLASFPRLTDRLLRLCSLKQSDSKYPAPLSLNMSLADLLLVRREIMFIFVNLAGFLNLSALPSSIGTRIARRIFGLIASYLVDPIDCVPPLASVQLSGVAPNASLRPPALADMALEVFTRISQYDVNRHFLANAVPQHILWQLVTSLVHRVPMIEADFLLMQRDYWQSYVEKTIMGIYSLIFMAPYELKQKIKADKSLGIKNVLLRMAQRVLLVPNHDGRGFFVIPARRAVEAMKLLDKAEEKVDAVEPAMPALQFGMGFGDGDDKSHDKGTGLLGANKDVAWEMLMMREVLTDEVFFNELDSLVRVECP
jgi:SWI/SNF chromatin-remodeling complex subunit SWI1